MPTASADVQTQMYSLADVCRIIGISYANGWEMLQQGRFPIAGTQVGRQWKFPKQKVDRFASGDLADPIPVADAVPTIEGDDAGSE